MIARKRRRLLLPGVVGLALGVTALILQPVPASAATNISILDACAGGDVFCYSPTDATTTVGTQVVWTNNGGSEHTVTRCTAGACGVGPGSGTDSSFTSSGVIPPGGRYIHTFTAPGKYNYYCQIHGYLDQRGSVTVSGTAGSTTTTRPPSTTTTTVASGARPVATIGDVALTEGDTKTRVAYFPVTLSKASTQTITLNYATANGSATTADYAAKTGTLSLAAGKVKGTIAVPVKGDTVDEADETFTVNLSAPVNATIGDAAGAGTIRDDDPSSGLRLTVSDVTVDEGDAGAQTATFTVSLSAATTSTVTVAYATANGSAVQPGDYAAKSGTLTIAAGTVSKSVAVTVKSDNAVEPNETFTVGLSNATGGATISDATGVGTIRTDD